MNRNKLFYALFALGLWLAACSPVPEPQIHYDPGSLRFSGKRALELETEFVTQFPNRDSGQPNNRLAAEWLFDQYTALGFVCQIDEWQVVNYSRTVPLQNVVCRLSGESSKEILVVAHFDQSPDTVYGADNDGSGTAIMLQLAEIFASEGTPRYTMVFVATDGEEYGMLGTRRYVGTHPDVSNIIAGFSLDNLGKEFYDGLEMSPIGQFRSYGPLWLQCTAQEAARAAGNLWVPSIRSPLDQVLNQAVPVSFMDQGPMVAAGIPAFGFAALVKEGYGEAHWESYHTPNDTLDIQSADVLEQSGRAPEALLRELLARDTFPSESGPYLYFQGSGQVLRGLPLWLIFLGFTALFFLAAYFKGKRMRGWREALPPFLALWLPLLASIVLTYLMVAVGLMDKYELYPATAKDEPLFNPRWPAVVVFVVGLAVFLWLGRRLAARYAGANAPSTRQINGLALFVIGVGAVYILAINPFSLLFLVPTLFWFLIGGRRGWGKALDIIFLLLGGLVVYALIYFFGFVTLRDNFAVLWYLLMMFSIGEVSFPTAAAITAILAAGLSMVVNPPLRAKEGEVQ